MSLGLWWWNSSREKLQICFNFYIFRLLDLNAASCICIAQQANRKKDKLKENWNNLIGPRQLFKEKAILRVGQCEAEKARLDFLRVLILVRCLTGRKFFVWCNDFPQKRKAWNRFVSLYISLQFVWKIINNSARKVHMCISLISRRWFSRTLNIFRILCIITLFLNCYIFCQLSIVIVSLMS